MLCALIFREMLTLRAPHVDKLDSDFSSDEMSENVLSDSVQEEEYLNALGNVNFCITDLMLRKKLCLQ